jgi:SAM-dependent methyltransferase
MKGFLDLPYRRPFVEHYKTFDHGFYVDFPKQLALMGRWLKAHGCRRTLDIGAMTGGCIEHISSLGIRMDGVQFTEDIRRIAAARLRRAGIVSRLFVSPVHEVLRMPDVAPYDGIVSLGWLNLPFRESQLRRTLRRIRELLVPGGVFLFDFFEFDDVKVPPTEAVELSKDLVYVSHAELRRGLLRRYHLWIRDHEELLAESSDLVRRTSAEARRLLRETGFEVVETRFLDFHYPREFWLVRRAS